MTTPTQNGAISAAPDGEQKWTDNYTETSFNPGGGGGNQWEDWGKVMYQAINPPLSCIEDELKRVPVDDPIEKNEVNVLWDLMLAQINAPCARYNLELRFLNQEARFIADVMEATGDLDDQQYFNLDPTDWTEFGALFYSIPMKRLDCQNRLDDIRERVQMLHGLMRFAESKGVYYDVCGLIDWFATPQQTRTTDSPSHALPSFGQKLFGILGMAAQNTKWAHIEAVTSRQIAPKFGGDPYQNSKTQFHNMNPNAQGGVQQAQNNVASNAPR